MSTTAYLNLGSNIEPKTNLAFAVKEVQQKFPDCKLSSVYQTPAQGFVGDDFLNLAIEINTQISLIELLKYADSLEKLTGRKRVKRGNFDSRTLDVDVLMYGGLVGRHEGRDWPAPDLIDYGHVLKPLAEIAQFVKPPLSKYTFIEHWNQFEEKQQFERVVKVYDIACLDLKS